ncbi:MAG: hypothetical protein QGF94_01195 [Candidatus Thalassarchaeaceae archaeon]|nr:hypothetical protein [Candidatus Thalassarchaeaceae archaeon]
MKRTPVLIAVLMLSMTLSPVVATIVSPNDRATGDTLSVDGFVTTKYASVGSEVEIMSLTRGHSSNTIVTADILRYDIDPIEIMTSASLPDAGSYVDTIVLVQDGPHEDDSNTMTWRGTYTIPVNALGGVYGASITAEDGNLRATDDPTQLSELLREEFEKVMQALDNAWDSANPTMPIKGEFDALETLATSAGGWSAFVATAREGQGSGGSQQLWYAMIDAGHNQYNMSAGANFLETLMDFLDSEDVDASMALLTGLLTYMNEFPLPRTFTDFDEMIDYMMMFDPIENFTRFAGTDDFEAAYNAMLGSDEWLALEEALNNLANNTKLLESTQTVMHNIALLAVSGHPEAIIDGMISYLEPLLNGDFENMTPFQQLIVRWVEMADYLDEPDIQDTDGDEIPDQIIWQYEKLMETAEGQAWTAKMESSSTSSYVNDAFDDFNTLPEDCINHVVDTFSEPIWENVGTKAGEFVEWIENASINREMEWYPEGDEEDEGTEGGEGENRVIFDELYNVRTSFYHPNVLDLSVELNFWGPWDDDDYPSQFTMSMNNNHGETVNTVLEQDDNDRHKYIGRLTANHIDDAIWAFTQPMADYVPDCAEDGCQIERAELRIEELRPGLLEANVWEGMDEIFIVSAVGVLVDQDETTLVNGPFTLDALSYDSSGPVAGADIDIAIVRVSPQQAEQAFAQFSPEGEVELVLTSNQITGQYGGSDLDGDVTANIYAYDEEHEDHDGPHPQMWDGELEISGMGSYWAANSELPEEGGLAFVSTSGTVDTGLEFEFEQVVPLPGSSGCARTEASSYDSTANIGYRYAHFYIDGDEDRERIEYEKPELNEIEIDWGDGHSWTHTNSPEDHRDEGWISHDYSESWEEANEHHITVRYTDENSQTVEHHFTYKSHHGYMFGEEEYREWTYQGWCDLDYSTSFTPSPQIIDGFITDGPLEVMDERLFTSDADGMVSMTTTPSLPGVYVSIVQSKVTLSDGEVMTGVGLNLVAVTEASVSLGDLYQETTFAGLPVYSVTPDTNGLTTISVTPTGIESDEYTAMLMVQPLDLSIPFPDIDESVWSESGGEYELEFQQGDTARTQEMRINAPISLIAVAVMEDEEQMWPSALHIGFLLNSPSALEMTGTLGPGQTTNIALNDDVGPASRILAIAAPEVGFDAATLDLPAFSELLYSEALRPEIGWIAAEEDLQNLCEEFEGWHEERWDDGQQSNVRMKVRVEYNEFTYSGPDYDPSNIVLTDSEGNEVTPTSDWFKEEWESSHHANFNLEAGMYTLTGITGGETQVEYIPEEWSVQMENNKICLSDEEMTESEIFDLLDDFLGALDSVAWGLGSSADLTLPILSAPQDEYTVLAIAQVGQGESASMVSALDSQVAEPNPEPPVLQNLTLTFSPANPMPGDVVQITALNEDNQPVRDLSATLVRDNVTLYGLITDNNGQVEFGVTIGTIVVRVSGGMYNPAEITIVVTEDGTETGGGDPLPSDTDGDGTPDDLDAFPLDPNEWKDTDGDGIGDNADETPNGEPDDVLGCMDDSANNYNANATVDDESCTYGPDDNNTQPVDNNTTPPVNNETDSGQGDGDESSSASSDSSMGTLMIVVGSIIGTALVGGAVLLFMRGRREREEDMWGHDEIDPSNEMFASNAPGGPPPGIKGEMRDGYEVVEYPDNSGAWWWRDPSSGKWNEWQ